VSKALARLAPRGHRTGGSLLALMIGFAFAQVSYAQVKHDLDAMYAIQDAAIKKNDLQAFMGTLAPDYSITLLSGDTFNREQIEGYIKSDMAHTKRVDTARSTIDSLLLENDEAIVIVTQVASRVLADANGVPHRWENKVVHKETWIATAAGWRLRRLEEVKQVYLLRDGKPLRR
jgi:hypothetical protein